jgi:nitric oxide reductase NorD protein
VAGAVVEQAIQDQLSGQDTANLCSQNHAATCPLPRFQFGWFCAERARRTASAATETNAPPATATVTTGKWGYAKMRREADRKDSFVMHRFESILAGGKHEHRSVDDDDNINAAGPK